MAARSRRRGWFFGRSRGARVARAVLLPVLVPAGLLLLLVLLPVLLPLVAYQLERDRKRRAAAAAVTPCIRCGAMLGPVAEALADKVSADEFAARREAYPDWTWRIVRHVWAVCAACGARYGFDEARRVFTPLHEAPQGHLPAG